MPAAQATAHRPLRPWETPTVAPTDIAAYYDGNDAVYAWWSQAMHMHHGYWRRGVPLQHEAMLEAMIDRVTEGLQLPADAAVADLGCGYGATANHIAETVPGTTVDGYTIVPAQVAWANARAAPGVTAYARDYCHTGAPDAAYDGVFCLESLCHAEGRGKLELLAEIDRILKPDGRLVIVDGFRTGPQGALGRYLEQQVTSGWAVGCFAHIEAVTDMLAFHGFTDIRVEDAGWRIAPTVLVGHWRMFTQAMSRWWHGEGWTAAELAHMWAGVHGAWLGLCRSSFRYLIVEARKSDGPATT